MRILKTPNAPYNIKYEKEDGGKKYKKNEKENPKENLPTKLIN